MEHGVYSRQTEGDLLIMCLYVNDFLITGSNNKIISIFKEELKAEFEMSDLGDLSYFLGIEFAYTSRGILLHQKRYALEILKRFRMDNCNAATTPVEANLKPEVNNKEKEVDATLYKQMIGCLRF